MNKNISQWTPQKSGTVTEVLTLAGVTLDGRVAEEFNQHSCVNQPYEGFEMDGTTIARRLKKEVEEWLRGRCWQPLAVAQAVVMNKWPWRRHIILVMTSPGPQLMEIKVSKVACKLRFIDEETIASNARIWAYGGKHTFEGRTC